jgi:hypothetical protein
MCRNTSGSSEEHDPLLLALASALLAPALALARPPLSAEESGLMGPRCAAAYGA